MANESRTPTANKSARRCSICGRPASPDVMPFCSPRCRDVDLHRWLSNSYVIPAAADDGDDVE
jgi:uncharacterized protein